MTCNLDVNDYSIELIQGDYGSYVYHITNSDGTKLENVKSVIFTCARLKLQKTLVDIGESNYVLTLDSATTQAFSPYTHTYDITILFNDEATPYTVIYNANFTVLKKENVVNEQK